MCLEFMDNQRTSIIWHNTIMDKIKVSVATWRGMSLYYNEILIKIWYKAKEKMNNEISSNWLKWKDCAVIKIYNSILSRKYVYLISYLLLRKKRIHFRLLRALLKNYVLKLQRLHCFKRVHFLQVCVIYSLDLVFNKYK